VVLVGDLSHYAANIFSQSGAIIKTIPIDEQGLDVDYIKTFCKGQFAVFIFVLIVITHNCFINSRTSLKTVTVAKGIPVCHYRR
jgi:GntR family transcriptional regulator/MocR family aminotransferase